MVTQGTRSKNTGLKVKPFTKYKPICLHFWQLLDLPSLFVLHIDCTELLVIDTVSSACGITQRFWEYFKKLEMTTHFEVEGSFEEYGKSSTIQKRTSLLAMI